MKFKPNWIKPTKLKCATLHISNNLQFLLQVAPRASHNQKGYTLLGFGRDFKQNRGEVLTSLQLNVQPVGSCTKQYNKILEDPTDDLYELVINTLPDGFEEDSLICAQIPGNNFNMISIILDRLLRLSFKLKFKYPNEFVLSNCCITTFMDSIAKRTSKISCW